MEMGKHIIVFITAILMPFMAYGDECSSITNVDDCNKYKGCGWIVIPEPGQCGPCSAGYYNSGDGQGCKECDKDGFKFLAKDFIFENDEYFIQHSLDKEDIIGLTSNVCPYWIKCKENEEYLPNNKMCIPCTAGLYNENQIYVFKGDFNGMTKIFEGETCSPKTFNITLKYQIKSANGCEPPNTDPQEIGKEEVKVSLLPTYNETELLISAQQYTETLRNQYNLDSYATLSYTDADTDTSETCRVYQTNINADGTPYKMGYKAEVKNCKDLLEAAPNNAELTLTLLVTQKTFQYVLVPLNSVDYDNNFSVVSAGNASGVKEGCFGNQIKLENTDEKATYYQYNNCEYYQTDREANCKDTEPTTTREPENGLLTLDYGFTYTDGTIIVLERATECQAGQYCPTYTTTDDTNCPTAFWSDKNAISITDCYLDSEVKFFDVNKPDGINLIEGETKLFYTPMTSYVAK